MISWMLDEDEDDKDMRGFVIFKWRWEEKKRGKSGANCKVKWHVEGHVFEKIQIERMIHKCYNCIAVYKMYNI